MSAETFFHRWSRLKGETGTESDAALPAPAGDVPAPVAGAAPTERPPTLQDVESLDSGSDYSAFVAQGVDKAVHRLALKKLFSDPHFNLKDGLDIYMDDYNQPNPVSAAMLGALQHAQSFFAQAAALEPKPGADQEAPAQVAASETAGPEREGAA